MSPNSCSRLKTILSASILFVASFSLTIFLSCVKTPNDTVPLTGSISGRITDASTDSPIADVQITTIPATTSVLSNSTGNYSISGVNPGQYTVYATKTGYIANSVAVTVSAGQGTVSDVTLNPIVPDLSISPNPLTFGPTETSLLLNLSNQNGTGSISWTATTDKTWIGLSATQGTVSNQTQHITITISRDSLTPGNYTGSIVFTSNGGNPTVQVLMTVSNPSLPQLSLNVASLDFDTVSTSKQFTITNTGSSILNWQIGSNQPWLSANPVSGTTNPSTNRAITVSVSRSGLSGGYYNGVVAITSNGGNINLAVTMRVLATRPFAPSNLRAQLVSGRAVTLTWSDNANNEEGFRIERRLSTQLTFNTLATLPPNSITYSDTGLAAHTRYIYRAYAYNQGVNSDYSNADSSTTSNLPPLLPSNPIPANLATNQACNGTLQWSATDPDLDSLHYDLYLGQGSTTHLLASNITTVSQTFAGLKSDTAYTWRVDAKDNYNGITTGSMWSFLTGPPVGITFNLSVTHNNVQEGRFITQTVDHGYVCIGSTGYSTSEYHMWVAKYSETGTEVWSHVYGGTGIDQGQCIRQTYDGGYIAVGRTTSYGNGLSDVWLVRLDQNGDTLWTRTFGGIGYDDGWSVIQTGVGDFVIAGHTLSFGNDRQMYLLKANSNGQEIWHQTFGGAYSDGAFSVLVTLDNGYVATGWKTDAFGNSSWWLLKVNSSGVYQWDRLYSAGGPGSSAYSVCQATNGDFVMTGLGVTMSNAQKMWIIRTNSSGNQIWLRQYGGSGADFGNSVIPTTDGGLAIIGMTQSYGAGGNDAWLMKTNANGDSLWSRTYGGTGDDKGVSIQQTYDGGYAVIGQASPIGSTNSSIWIFKTDLNGNVTGMH